MINSEAPLTNPNDDMAHLDLENLKDFISAGDREVEQDLKIWLMGALLLWTAPAFSLVFYMGQINSKLDNAFAVQEAQQSTLSERRVWMDQRERFEEGLTGWAKTQGYVPLEPVR